ncbi:MAG: hypothetical protein ACKVP2_18065 [Burkholderiales bacterium]
MRFFTIDHRFMPVLEDDLAAFGKGERMNNQLKSGGEDCIMPSI